MGGQVMESAIGKGVPLGRAGSQKKYHQDKSIPYLFAHV
jgi:hypothetical protein